MLQRMMNAEEFSLKRSELPDAGQWAELIRGVPLTLSPPDIEHGTIVLNLSKAFAAYVQMSENGYPCFDLGLKVESRPDTVLYPAISYFRTGPRFAEADKDYTETVPELVVELVTTSDRRGNINERSQLYINRGTKIVWVIDPAHHTVHIIEKGVAVAKHLQMNDFLTCRPLLEGFSIHVSQIFQEPDWV